MKLLRTIAGIITTTLFVSAANASTVELVKAQPVQASAIVTIAKADLAESLNKIVIKPTLKVESIKPVMLLSVAIEETQKQIIAKTTELAE